MRLHPKAGGARSAAVGYLKKQLQGGKKFASLLLELDFESGDLSVLVPHRYSETELLQFDRAHLIGEGPPKAVRIGKLSGVALQTPNADAELADVLCRKLETPGTYCLLENYLAAPEDPVLQGAKSRIATCGSDVYHLLIHADGSTRVRDTIREAHSAPAFLGAGGQAAELPRYGPARITLSLDELRVLSASVDFVFASAYDGEGYLCWQKGSRE